MNYWLSDMKTKLVSTELASKPSGTFKKIGGDNPYGNQIKLLWHLDRIYQFKNMGTTFPIQVELNPTSQCNMRCKWCITEYAHKNESLSIDHLNRFLAEFRAMGGKSIGWTGGGEPGIYPHIQEAVETAAKVGLRQGMMTNGLFKPGLVDVFRDTMTWIRFSLDTVDPASYSAMKGVTPNALKHVLRNIERLSSQSPRPRVVVNVNLSRWNSLHVIDTLQKSRELGVDGFQIRPILPRVGETYTREDIQFYTDWLRRLPELQQYQTKDFQIFISYDKFKDVVEGRLNVRDYDRCQYHQFIVVLDSNGDLCVCTHHMGDDRFTFGNIYHNTVKEIWASDKRKAAIEHCNRLDFKECQACCKGHEINKFLHFIQNPISKSDPDFF